MTDEQTPIDENEVNPTVEQTEEVVDENAAATPADDTQAPAGDTPAEDADASAPATEEPMAA